MGTLTCKSQLTVCSMMLGSACLYGAAGDMHPLRACYATTSEKLNAIGPAGQYY